MRGTVSGPAHTLVVRVKLGSGERLEHSFEIPEGETADVISYEVIVDQPTAGPTTIATGGMAGVTGRSRP